MLNGFGGHRIEGIGDKHVPWVHNVKNTDMVIAIDDEACMHLMRLFNEPAGRTYLVKQGVPATLVDRLDLLGISSIANVLSAIKFARWYELDEHDLVLTVFTDSIELYDSRLLELHRGERSGGLPSLPDGLHGGLCGKTGLLGAPAGPQPEILYLG